MWFSVGPPSSPPFARLLGVETDFFFDDDAAGGLLDGVFPRAQPRGESARVQAHVSRVLRYIYCIYTAVCKVPLRVVPGGMAEELTKRKRPTSD